MRKMTVISLILALCILFSGCVPSEDTPAEELRQYAWCLHPDVGSEISLCFEDTNAAFTVKDDGFTLSLQGLCVVTDDRMSICDQASSVNYTFSYILHGDRVELGFNGGTISLNKQR